jgi:hypothetical protein
MPGSLVEASPSAGDPSRSAGRVDIPISVPLLQLFIPDPDPTEHYPGQSADLEGYVVTPGNAVTIAATSDGPSGVDLLDSLWASLRRKGIGRRHITVLNDRGRIVSVMTLHFDAPEETVGLLRSLLVVPVHARDGLAEVHLFASPEELEVLAKRIDKGGRSPIPSSAPTLPPARETGALEPEDWAFLGLLSTVGAFDGPEAPSPTSFAELLGIDMATFAERARAVDRGLSDVVAGLFAAPGLGSTVEGPAV